MDTYSIPDQNQAMKTMGVQKNSSMELLKNKSIAVEKSAASLFLTALFFVLSASNVKAINYYWIGGTGNWDDLNHWSTTSGGTVLNNEIPIAFDDVFFEVHSFNAAGQIVTLNPHSVIRILTSTASPVVTLSASPGTIICPCNATTSGELAQDNAGISPRYDFMVNGNIVPSGFANSFTSSTLLNGDAILCMIYLPASPCFAATTATFNSITLIIGNNNLPAAIKASVSNDQLPYLWNGQAYDSSGDYTWYFTNSTGCDSIVTLHFTIANNTHPAAIEAIGCNKQLPYLWNGMSYKKAGNDTLNFTNSAGCDSAITPHLSVYTAGSGSCSGELIIPNAIITNGDGINDYWKISHTASILKTGVSIYNRYGSFIYHNEDYQNEWHGIFRSAPCPAKTYYYVIRQPIRIN